MITTEKIIAILAVVQISKYYGAPRLFLPILAMMVGAILEFSDDPTGQGVLNGIVVGAITTGVYGVVKDLLPPYGGKSQTSKPQNIQTKSTKCQTSNIQTNTYDKKIDLADLEPDDDRRV